MKHLFGELRKVDSQGDGTIIVHGIASTGARDSQGEIVTPEAMKAAIPDYLRLGPALREMHQQKAAGVTLLCEVADNGETAIAAHVVDSEAIKKVKAQVYRGFSIGGRVLKRDPSDAATIVGIQLIEISLVDRPSNPEATIALWKMDQLPTADVTASLAALEDAITGIDKALRAHDLAKLAAGRIEPGDRAAVGIVRKQLGRDPVALAVFEKLMAEPLPPKTAGSNFAGLQGVEKRSDGCSGGPIEPSNEDVEKMLLAMSPEDRAMVLMKSALRLPTPIEARL